MQPFLILNFCCSFIYESLEDFRRILDFVNIYQNHTRRALQISIRGGVSRCDIPIMSVVCKYANYSRRLFDRLSLFQSNFGSVKP
ncbi:hypothetical protein L6452_39807 [Arctium lappa]|uniref:Uncharacterized protein n=1 Tax=Arctium lappa TaxID=4217 RepID=A0ACB8XV03_ARCLA|nr:hypothetical protein L6452_39807 [Arctium lappa]